MDPVIMSQLIAIGILFVSAAFLSVAETALIGMSRLKIIAHIKNAHPKAKYLQVWMKEPNKLLATLSICINAVAIGSSTVGAFLSLRLALMLGWNESLTASLTAIIITVIIIIFGEITPKIFAIHNTEKLGLLLIAPVVFVYRLIAPVTEVFVKISSFTVRLFGGKPSDSIPVITARDIDTMIDVSAEAGYIDEQAKVMMSSILEFKGLTVNHVMVPRTATVGIDIEWEIDKIIDVVTEEGYSRMPVFKENLDNVVGILYTKDMLTMIKNRGLVILHDLMRIPYFVPETKKLSDLLKEFKKGHIHIAVVVDEFGGTAGIVTMEDILEEIVGEIKDEYDMEEKEIETLSQGVFTVRGNTEIGKINEFCKVEIPDEDEVNTIGGFVSSLAGNVPKEGEKIDFGRIVFTVLKSDVRRVVKLKMEITEKEIKSEDEA